MYERGLSIILITDQWICPKAEIAHAALPAALVSPPPFDAARVRRFAWPVVESCGRAEPFLMLGG